jgi:RNA polymerase sigma-B factor
MNPVMTRAGAKHSTDQNLAAANTPAPARLPHSRASTPPEAPPDCGQPGSGEDEYQHLEPVLAAYAAMGAHDPRRAELRERLVTGYLPAACHIASRYAQRGEPLDDLQQVGCVGLLKAIDGFEPEQGFSFLAYAAPTITGEIRRHFRDRTWTIRIPRRLKDLNAAINKTVAELTARLHRAPRPSDIAAELNIPTEQVLEALHASSAYRPSSLDETLTTQHGSATRGQLLGEDDTRFQRFVDSYSLAPHLAALPVRHRDILIMRFFHEMTQTQIAERVGVSQMQISRQLAAILTQLRDALDPTPHHREPTLDRLGTDDPPPQHLWRS